MSAHPSAPLAAAAGLLALLALVALSRPRAPVAEGARLEASEAPATPPEESIETPQRQRLLAAEPLDLNLATAADLELLPRIGPALAGRIIAERDRARFESVDSLLRVRGIGPRTLERLRPWVTVLEPPARPEG